MNHCLRRITNCAEIKKSQISVKNADIGSFNVTNSSTKENHDVEFNGPSCSCKDFRYSNLPCKHIFAVLKYFPGVSWDTLPATYRNSVFVTIDFDAIFEDEGIERRDEVHRCLENPPVAVAEQEFEGLTAYDSVIQLPSRKAFSHRSKASACREVLKEITSLTYLIYDHGDLASLLECLNDISSDLKSKVHAEEGLLLNAAPKAKNNASNGSHTHSVKDAEALNIPLRKSRKRILTGRVGEGADKTRKSKVLKIEEKVATSTKTVIEEHDLMSVNNDQHHESKADKECSDVAVDDPVVCEFHTLKENTPQRKKKEVKSVKKVEGKKAVARKDNDSDLFITGFVPSSKTNPSSRPRVRKINLREDDFSCISKGRMLTDVHINFCQRLLHEEFPQIRGFEDTSRGPVGQFSIFRGTFVQILHDGSLHWVCVSNAFVPEEERHGTVHCYDSLNSDGTVTEKVVKQIADFSFCKSDNLAINLKPVQQQTNGTNCGVFAIAYAMCLVNGIDPTTVRFDEKRMRKHLVSCMEEKRLTLFPRLNYVPRPRKGATVKVSLYCTCRCPYDANAKMARCDHCKLWFHQKCMDIPQAVFEERSIAWFCKGCGK